MKKTIKDYLASALLCFAFFGVLACSSDKETAQNLTVKGLTINTDKIDFQSAESNADITINSEATAWLLQNSEASWLKISKSAGTTGTTVVQITALQNTTSSARTAVITLSSGEANSLQIKV